MASRAIGKGHPQKFNVDRVPGQPKKRRKITLVFDEKKRRDFLGGFHKRKLQRQKKAQEELQQKLKEEKKRIKQDAREKYKTLLSQRDIPELEELLSKQEYEDDDRTVSILELNVADLAQRSNWIGTNRPVYEDEDEEDSDDDENAENDEDEVAGMELKRKPAKKLEVVEKKSNSQSKKEPETKKEIARAVKRAALKRVTTSKVFKQKQQLERQKNKKRSNQLKMRQEKMLKKSGKRGKSKKKLSRKANT